MFTKLMRINPKINYFKLFCRRFGLENYLKLFQYDCKICLRNLKKPCVVFS